MTEVVERDIGEGRERAQASLMTPIGVVEGEVLTYLETHGAASLRRLTRELDWPSPLVAMAVGALVRRGLVQAVRHDLEVAVDLVKDGGARPHRLQRFFADMWGCGEPA